MNGNQLRNSILQWAIQGKLVPQDPNDEPAAVLLDKIHKEKERLAREGKLKKDKQESIINRGEDGKYYERIGKTIKCIDEEIPFEISQGWEWCRLGTIVMVGGGKRIPAGRTLTTENTGHKYIRVTDMKNNTIKTNDIHYISKDIYQQIKSYTISKNDLYITVAGTIGAVGNVPIEFDNANLTENADKLVFTILNKKFLMYALLSDTIQSQIRECTTKVGQPKLAIKRIQNFLIPLPPLNEQQRIVEKLEELLPLIDRYEKAQEELDIINAEIKDKLKSSILQEAIQGKLVPQIAKEGTAYELLKQIKEEKQKLVKGGKLKKSAIEDSVIFRDDDNKYYEKIHGEIVNIKCDFCFPNSWSVVRLSSICALIDGEKKKGRYVSLDAKFLRKKSIGTILQEGRFVHKGDNIILVDGENSGEVFNVPCNGYMGSTFKQLLVSEVMYLPYVLYFIRFYKNLLRKSKRGAAIPHLNKDVFNSLMIGIPPYLEQVRIVNKIREINDLIIS